MKSFIAILAGIFLLVSGSALGVQGSGTGADIVGEGTGVEIVGEGTGSDVVAGGTGTEGDESSPFIDNSFSGLWGELGSNWGLNIDSTEVSTVVILYGYPVSDEVGQMWLIGTGEYGSSEFAMDRPTGVWPSDSFSPGSRPAIRIDIEIISEDSIAVSFNILDVGACQQYDPKFYQTPDYCTGTVIMDRLTQPVAPASPQ